MRPVSIETALPSKRDLVERWAMNLQPRTWDLDIARGHQATVLFLPHAAEGPTWKLTIAGISKSYLGSSLEALLTVVAEEWHESILADILLREVVPDLDMDDAEADQLPLPEPDRGVPLE